MGSHKSKGCYSPEQVPSAVTPGYHVSGSLSPDSTCNYVEGGLHNGKTYYSRVAGIYFLWWDGIASWILSNRLGLVPNGHWFRTDPSPFGSYTPSLPYTGTAVFSVGGH